MEILLNPGPVNLSKRVRQALLKPDLCHREPEFSDLQHAIRRNLLSIYALSENDWAAILLTGSGTSAMEAMLISMVPADGKVLIIENGIYGERLSKIAEIYNIAHEKLHFEWGDAIDTGKLAQTLQDGYTHAALVHHETTTGRLNDIGAIAEICRSKNVPILLDGVSSFGAEAIRFEDWNIAACAATANKCLHGIPGTSFVVINREALSKATNIQRSNYLDLDTYLTQQDQGGTPFTQSVQSFYALDEALNEHKEVGGWPARREIYRSRMATVVSGLKEQGIQTLLPDGESSCVLHAFHLPEGISYRELHDHLKQQGFVIYAGQGGLQKSIFRISLMGAIGDGDIQRLLLAIQSI